jgi:hypothetical protein
MMSSLWLSVVFLAAAGDPGPVDFDTDVLPILSKAGCNAAACHGAAAGRGGFKLSLFGGNPAADYDEIVHQLEGRRVNLAKPETSLVLLKPTGQLDHEGGDRLEYEGADAKLLEQWIAAGASRRQLRRLVSLEVEPAEVVVPRTGMQLPLKVEAVFDDGTRRDVASQAIYTPGDPAAIEADANGRLTVHRRGRHSVVVRYLSLVRTAHVTTPLADEQIDLSAAPRFNWIDEQILQTLEDLRLPPSPQADDATLLRRVTLDLTGRLPTPKDVRDYLADDDADKFRKLVDRLIESPEFTEYWTYEFAKLLRIRAQPQESQAANVFHAWVRERLAQGTSLAEMATALLTAEGDTHTNGPANFYRVAGDARAQAEYVSELLMGVRLRCANCHNHPLDHWTQDDYHGLAAVFARIERGRNIRYVARGEVTHPATGEAAVPRIPGETFLPADADGRPALAQWLSAEDNPYFATVMVNRLWKSLMGRGLVEPTDDLRATNPATHPPLLDRLAEDFIRHNYDLRHTLRLVANSAAYQRSSRTTDANRVDDRFYSHAIAKPLHAEVMADALADVTGVRESYGNLPPGTRAVSLVDPKTPSESLDILGRCSREDSCEASGDEQGGLTTKLHLINGPLLNAKIMAPQGWLQKSLLGDRSTGEVRTIDDIIEDFYLRALGRFPRENERTYWQQQLNAQDQRQRRERLEDFVWSLLNCTEFTTNH